MPPRLARTVGSLVRQHVVDRAAQPQHGMSRTASSALPTRAARGDVPAASIATCCGSAGSAGTWRPRNRWQAAARPALRHHPQRQCCHIDSPARGRRRPCDSAALSLIAAYVSMTATSSVVVTSHDQPRPQPEPPRPRIQSAARRRPPARRHARGAFATRPGIAVVRDANNRDSISAPSGSPTADVPTGPGASASAARHLPANTSATRPAADRTDAGDLRQIGMLPRRVDDHHALLTIGQHGRQIHRHGRRPNAAFPPATTIIGGPGAASHVGGGCAVNQLAKFVGLVGHE